MKKKKILITGGNGYLGKHISDIFIKNHHDVTLLDIRKPKKSNKNCKFILCNINDKKKLEIKLKNFHTVFHFAASADLYASNKDPYSTIQNNIIGTINILEACIKNNVKKIFYASSIYALSEQGGFYSTSKLASEMLIERYAEKYNLKFVILRFGSIYGGQTNYFNTLSNFISDAVFKGKIIRKSKGNEIRNYINIDDVAKKCLLIFKQNHNNKYINIFGPKRTKIKDVLNLIKKSLPKTKITYSKIDQLKYNYVINPFTYKMRRGTNFKISRYQNFKSDIQKLIEQIQKKNEASSCHTLKRKKPKTKR